MCISSDVKDDVTLRTDRAPKTKRERMLRKKNLLKKKDSQQIDSLMQQLFPIDNNVDSLTSSSSGGGGNGKKDIVINMKSHGNGNVLSHSSIHQHSQSLQQRHYHNKNHIHLHESSADTTDIVNDDIPTTTYYNASNPLMEWMNEAELDESELDDLFYQYGNDLYDGSQALLKSEYESKRTPSA